MKGRQTVRCMGRQTERETDRRTEFHVEDFCKIFKILFVSFSNDIFFFSLSAHACNMRNFDHSPCTHFQRLAYIFFYQRTPFFTKNSVRARSFFVIFKPWTTKLFFMVNNFIHSVSFFFL